MSYDTGNGPHRRKLRAIIQLQGHVEEELALLSRRRNLPERVKFAQAAALNAQAWAVDEMLYAFVMGGPAHQPKPNPENPEPPPDR
jgi:hypothetical protein